MIAGGALTVVSIQSGLLSQDAGNIDPTAVEDLLFDVEAPIRSSEDDGIVDRSFQDRW